jgi:multidrug efflux pump subunit AcrB
MALRLATGGNLLEAIQNVRGVLDQMEPYLPEGVQ